MQLPDSHTTAIDADARQDQVEFESEIELGQYTRALTRQWKILAAGALLGSISGLGIAAMRPTVYEAATTILLGNTNAPGSGPTSRALLSNYSLAVGMLKDVGLDQPPASWTAYSFVQEALVIEEVPGTTLVKVKVRLADPIKAAQASNALSKEAVGLNRRIATEQSTAVRRELADHLNSSAERLSKAEQELLGYMNAAQIEVLRTDADALLDERGTLLKLTIDLESEKARLASAEQEILKQERVLSVGRAPRAEESLRRAAKPSPGQAQAPTQGVDVADPEALDLSAPFINPVYQTLAFQIATSRTRLAGLERQRREMVSRKIAGEQFDELSELHRRELRLAQLQAAHDLAKQVHADLSLRYEQSRTESVINMVQLQIVDEAIAPDRPLSKKRAETAALGLVAGLLASIVIALAWGAARARVTTASG